ncbi:MAG: hypothetical protein WC417_07545, partial [Candidatus Omnitrophota bacterium]
KIFYKLFNRFYKWPKRPPTVIIRTARFIHKVRIRDTSSMFYHVALIITGIRAHYRKKLKMKKAGMK